MRSDRFRVLPLLLIVFLTLGCASKKLSLDSKKKTELLQTADGKGNLFVAWERENLASAFVSASVSVNKEQIGRFKSGQFFKFSLEPGVYEVDVSHLTRGSAGKKIEVEPGRNTYVLFSVPSELKRFPDEYRRKRARELVTNYDALKPSQSKFRPLRNVNLADSGESDRSSASTTSSTSSSTSPSRRRNDELANLLDRTQSSEQHENRYAFVIGIEDYSSAPEVPYASRSAEFFKRTARKKLGVPEGNIKIVKGEEATGTRIKGVLRSFLNYLDEDSVLYFYYAGHAVPARKSSKSYLLPRDAYMGAYQDPFFAINNIYDVLGNSDAGRVYAFIDSCFSGKAGPGEMVFDGIAPAGRTTRGSSSSRSIPEKMSVFVAGNNEQFANVYEEKGHRLFSYFVMKGLLEAKEGENFTQYVKSNVSEVSRKRGLTYQQDPEHYGPQLDY